MKVFEIAGPVFTGPSADFAPKMEAPQEELTSAEDVVLSKNGEQAVRELKLSDQEVELLKAVALGWADMSDLGDLEQDIFEYWFGNNPEDFNPDLHGGGADPSDTIMDELEGWFEDKNDDQKTFDAEFKAADDRIKRDALADSEIKEWGKPFDPTVPKRHPYTGEIMIDNPNKHPWAQKPKPKRHPYTGEIMIDNPNKHPWAPGGEADTQQIPGRGGSHKGGFGIGRKKIKDDVDVQLARIRKLAGLKESVKMVYLPTMTEAEWNKLVEDNYHVIQLTELTAAEKAAAYQKQMHGIKAHEPWTNTQVDAGILNTEKSKRQSAQAAAFDKLQPQADGTPAPSAGATPVTGSSDGGNWWDTPGAIGFPPETGTVCADAYGLCKEPGGEWYSKGGPNDPNRTDEPECIPSYGICRQKGVPGESGDSGDWYIKDGPNDPDPDPWCNPAYGVCGGGWTPEWQAEQDKKKEEDQTRLRNSDEWPHDHDRYRR